MKRSFTIYLLVLCSFSACDDSLNKKEESEAVVEEPKDIGEDEVAIYRTSDPNMDISIKIDNLFNYHSIDENKHIVCCYEIGRMKKTGNKSSKIYLKINGFDTSFTMTLSNIKRIMFGPGVKQPFYIVTDENLNAFAID